MATRGMINWFGGYASVNKGICSVAKRGMITEIEGDDTCYLGICLSGLGCMITESGEYEGCISPLGFKTWYIRFRGQKW